MLFLQSFIAITYLSISLTNPIPPLAYQEEWQECVRTCHYERECGDMEYEECDWQYDPYELLQYDVEKDER